MAYQLLGNDGQPLDAHFDVRDGLIVLHSRSGAKGAHNARNTDYGPALRLLLDRLAAASLNIEGVWLDSSIVRHLPMDQRCLMEWPETESGSTEIFRTLSSRMREYGHAPGTKGGNNNKRILIRLAGAPKQPDLKRALTLRFVDADLRSAERLPAEMLSAVDADHIYRAVQRLVANPADHVFGPSRDFDLLTQEGDRLPPKAVFGLAATEALGFPVQPKHFTGGVGTPCFQALIGAGYEIVPKGTRSTRQAIPASAEDLEWTEGQPKLVLHLRRERSSGLAKAKKADFIRNHGSLRCQRCKMDPIEIFGGEHGEACIEVHHRETHIADMSEGHRSRLEDLECLCANCHRVVHRLLREAIRGASNEAGQHPS